MKHLLTGMMLAAALTMAVPIHGGAEPRHRLAVAIEPRFGGAPLVFDAMTNMTAAGQAVSVTRLDFLLSNIALRRADGGWLGLTNWSAYLSPREGRTGFELNNLPAGSYDRMRFQLGVPPDFNHADPAQFNPAHPLNPNVNGLHWSWQGGYVFLALEGNWRMEDRSIGGYSYHIATDRLLMTVELPVIVDLAGDREIALALNVDRIFSGTHGIRITEGNASTHSREDDSSAGRLRDNLQQAFTVESVRSPKLAASVATAINSIEMASDATPYRLEISRFFPRPALPLDNPLTEEGVALGRLLFLDPRLSVNNSQSCASCHDSALAFTDGRAVSIGAEGQAGTRGAMPLFNLAWKSSFFWDGRAASLREQILQPIQNPMEMHETLTNVVAKIRSARVDARHQQRAVEWARRQTPSPLTLGTSKSAPAKAAYYGSLFERAFGSPEVTADRIARVLEQFLLTQVSHNARFDRVIGKKATFTEQEQRGFVLFHTEYDPRHGQFGADCFHCHGGPLFQSQTFANNGLDAEPCDPGRFSVTARPGDQGKFAVPSLRNVAVTAPYMHDGRFATLEEVIEHYSTGLERSSTLDPNLAKHPNGGVPLSSADKQALVSFLKTLTDERFQVRARDGASERAGAASVASSSAEE